jgi:lipopolysaccharide/colanic/teichoic acid biosynthesis glycosyltransferase
VRQQLQRRQQGLGAAPANGLLLDLEPLPPVADVLDELWQDPDPDTALWVLWLQDQRQPERAAALRRQPRSGLPSHQALQNLIMGGGLDRAERLLQLLQVPWVAGLSPGALIDMVRWGRERRLDPGEVLFRIGDPSDIVAILLEGTCQVFRSDGSSNPPVLMATLRPGESIGEVAFFSALPRRSEVRAGEGVAVALVFDAGRFEVWSEASAAGASYRVQTSSLKRLMDVFIALPLLIFMSPLLIAIYVAIKLFDPGPALFRQLRVGRDGELFTVLKFRSMRVDAEARLTQLLAADPGAQEEWSRYQKLRHDPRVTFVGGILRKSSLDELPQLVNILRGEMSLIGPRPVTSAETHRYGSAYRFYTAVRPGVLGLWQVKGRNRLTYPQRVALDVRYVTTWSIWQDLKICMLAIPVVLFGLGAY